MTSSMYDVVIIGAGPAGTSAGYRLARAGRKVLILDRRSFPRKKACAGGITPKAMSLFPYDISRLVLRTCRRVKVTRPCGKSFLVKDKHPLCYMVQRRDLDYFSLQKALGAGAGFNVVERILSLENDMPGSHVRISVGENGRDEVLTARFVIGADGANSLVRRLLVQGHPRKAGRYRSSFNIRKHPALEADVNVSRPWAYPMEFDFSKGIPGYYWIFPRHDHVNIGIYAATPDFSPNQRLLADYARERFGHDSLEAVKGYPIGVRGPGLGSGFSGQGRVLLAGDAAGLAEPLLGEGIYAALESGKLAAEAVDQALGEGRENALGGYHRSLTGLRLDLGLYHLAAGAMYRFPGICLGLARHPLVLKPFGRGYAGGRSLHQIVFPF